MKHSPGFLVMVEAAKEFVKETSIDEHAKKIVAGNADFVLVDVREDNEWQAGHLPGSLHLSKGIIERDVEVKIPDKNAHIVLYCGGGYRSLLAGKALKEMGYKNVFSLAGGWREWKDKKLPIE